MNAVSRLLSLPASVKYPVLSQKRALSVLYVRECYEDLARIIISDTEHNRFIVSGNPGIGKTFFSLYLMHVLAKSGTEAIILDRAQAQTVLFERGKPAVEAVNAAPFTNLLYGPHALMLVDGKKPEFLPGFPSTGKVVLVASNKREHWWEFYKGNTRRLIMPPWVLEEMEAARVSCFPEVPQDVAERLFLRWGGIPRYVLEYWNDNSKQMLLDEAIGLADPDRCFANVGEVGNDKDLSHRILHMTIPPKEATTTATSAAVDELKDSRYDSHHFRMLFASQYVTDQLVQRWRRSNFDRLRHWILAMEPVRWAGGLQGQLFEAMAHTMLRVGGKFRCRKLRKSKNEQPQPEFVMVFPNTGPASLMYRRVDELHGRRDVYAQPVQKNEGAIDALIPPAVRF